MGAKDEIIDDRDAKANMEIAWGHRGSGSSGHNPNQQPHTPEHLALPEGGKRRVTKKEHTARNVVFLAIVAGGLCGLLRCAGPSVKPGKQEGSKQGTKTDIVCPPNPMCWFLEGLADSVDP